MDLQLSVFSSWAEVTPTVAKPIFQRNIAWVCQVYNKTRFLFSGFSVWALKITLHLALLRMPSRGRYCIPMILASLLNMGSLITGKKHACVVILPLKANSWRRPEAFYHSINSAVAEADEVTIMGLFADKSHSLITPTAPHGKYQALVNVKVYSPRQYLI